MLPVLLDLKFVKIYTFGIFLVLAFFWSSFVLWRNIRLTSYKEDEIFDGLFIALAGGLFFSRLLYVTLNFDKFGLSIFKFILINGFPGLSIYGALFGAFVTFYLYTKLKKINFKEVIDYMITPLFIALAFGKLGSFFSASGVGTKTNFFLAIKYVGYDGLRHLTGLYELIFFALGAYFSYRLLFAVRREKYSKGFVFYFFCWYFSLTYLLFDKLKVNRLYLIPLKTKIPGISFNFMISGVILLTLTIYFLYYFRNSVLFYGKSSYQKITKKIGGGIAQRGKETAKAYRGAKKK
ncbi:hypothetical protein A3C98_03155 [Candidatus Roizmanbacteria bacterium RIFCSPHIGHO2_02_FULL_37_15]|uniref:Prolipoprotein diacylglyceryl transferase n=1 Tax=Candidatus Roizmanbacteria bacterium RIFCSPLOWO2_01_FULL_37_16 TaxID=1802058 RepID=A0A1F7IJ54_9BACT|nr:MAG: hypothetical protein A2859_01215 [Candidatus Roizmanbacteria bacterium RIFCSPHIGHO2_01_FULL_37_16b]OGK21092.1 MAG: hypothetical protein A3C98_03155 [Candidatus Roizmanbacteria bacterium RIFCSPHIGHO2_02_FULL_37_15]OGK33094.1 MAG: hypothetical protein A3F57_05990 [Candidatus Roizmanbacteria bacterium RIFCSPHIGHO2_12_FULL_36_11]OGK43374.1 MAG: hypothetical protein A3B40_01090 [Candidatus Roizmanbacteria bacterium RIFCSPLOWO2_01_FULL_37_16]OGK55649.1 MAG: hypothetical protein A3I50_02855 [C